MIGIVLVMKWQHFYIVTRRKCLENCLVVSVALENTRDKTGDVEQFGMILELILDIH